MKDYIVLLIIIIYSLNSYGQLANSQKKTYASFYNASSSTLNFTTKELSFEYFIKLDSTRYEGDDSNNQTANKIHALFPKVGITETDNFLKINDLDFSEKNGWLVGLKYVYSVNNFFNYKDSKYKPQNIFTGRIEITGRTKNIKVLNPNSNIVNTENPFTFNMDGGIGFYLFNLNSSNIIMYPQVNVGADFLTYNEQSLKSNFISISKTTNTDSFIIINDSFEGVVGEYKDNVQQYYAGISWPFFFDYHWKKIPKVMLTPYSGFMNYSYMDNTKYNIGGSLSLLAKNFIDPENSQGIRKLNSPTFLNFGIDWVFEDEKAPSKANIYLSGGFSF